MKLLIYKCINLKFKKVRGKKGFSLLNFFLFSVLLNAQTEVNNNWKNQINPIFQGLNKNYIPNAILLDYAMEFTNVPAYNGTITDSTYVDANVLGNIYKTLFMGKVTTSTLHFPTIESIATNWVTHRRSYNQTEQNTIVIAGLFYQYARIKSDALATNKITVSANKYYDKFINSVWQNPYETLNTVAFTPAINTYNKKSFGIVLPQDLLLSNSTSLINKIELNCNDGSGYKIISSHQKIVANYAENGVYDWIFKTTLTNGTILYSQTKVKIEAPLEDQNTTLRDANTYENNVFIPGSGSGLSAYYNGAILRIDYAPSHNGQIVKPFIVAEGFDVGSITNPEVEGGDRTLNDNFYYDLDVSGFQLQNLLYNEYDIIYIDWQNGTNDIKENSKVLKSVLAWVNTKKQEAGSTQQNVLLGQSMGGLIGRYTLAKMEQEGVPHDVRLFIAHDSPLQGANTPLSTQYFTRHIYDNYTEAPILYGATEYLIPTLLNFAELLSFSNLEVSFPSLDDILTIQDTPAALQLNYHYVDILSNPTMLIHQDWQQEFDAMGYPQQCRNIAISNGNECAANHGFNAGDKFINLHSSLSPAVFGDLSGMLIDASIGLITTDFELVILGVLPGSSKYTFDFDLHSNPNIGASDRKVYYGKVRYEKKLLYLVTITHTVTERTKNAPNGYLPFDTYSGGFYDIRNVTNSIPINLSNSIFINPKYGFIPVVSALDIKRNNQIVNPSDYLKKYAGGVTPETALTSGFDNFIVDYNNGNATNNAHISFQVRNGNWLAEEMQVDISNPIYPSFNCQNFCSNAQITGNSNLCGTGIYSVTNEANYANWSITEGNFLVTFSANNNQVTINQVDQNQNGYITLNVTYGNTRCGSTTISKRIWVGKPNVTNPTINGPDNKPRNTTASYNVPLVEGAIQYQWSITNAAPNCGCTTNSQGLITCPTGTVFPKFYGTNSASLTTTYNAVTVDWGNCKGAYTLNCRAVNSCGSKDISFKVVNIYDPYNPNDPNNPCNNVLKIAPNPIKEGNINVIFGKVNPNGTPCDPIEHFPIENNNKFNVKIYDLFGERLYENNYTKNEFTIEGLHFKKGHYILNLTLNDKEMHREIFIVE